MKDLPDAAKTYAMKRGLEITGPLGDGLDGSIWKVRGKKKAISWALKIHAGVAGYRRERDCYLRLSEHQVCEVAGFQVPVLGRSDEEFLAIEMSMVARPFIVDFAQAYLDLPPEFSADVWVERLRTWSDRYGKDWPVVERALDELEDYGIYYLDVHQRNICVR
jgi:hypothetical protein